MGSSNSKGAPSTGPKQKKLSRGQQERAELRKLSEELQLIRLQLEAENHPKAGHTKAVRRKTDDLREAERGVREYMDNEWEYTVLSAWVNVK